MDVKVQGMATEDKTFVSTKATNSVKDAVDQYGVVMVTGPPGSGKTAMVNHIALQLQEQGYRICPVVSTNEIIEYWMPELPQVFVFNDPFGIHVINQSELHQWTNLQERLSTCFQYSNMKILATLRSHIIEDEQISENILSSSDLQTISLVNDESVLTDDERLKIFNAHVKLKKRDDLRAMGVEIQNFAISCFPLICRIYTSDEESKFSVKDFFQKPLSVISKDLDKFIINDPIRYFCLLYCMINDNNLDTDLLSINVESKTIETSRTILLEKCKVSTSLSREEIKSKIDTLLNTYLKLEGKCYHFIHDIIHDAVIRHVNGLPSDWKRIILQHCGPKFLNERIRLNASEYRQNEDGYLLLNSDLESVWSERILQDMIGDHMNWNHMVNNTTLSTEKGDMLLLQSFKCMDLTELQRFILLSHPCNALSPILEASKKLKTIDYMDLDLNVVAILHLIICLGLKKCLKHILKTALPITFKHIKVNLLLVACIMGQTDIVEMLLLNGYSANLFARSGHSVLFLSSFFGHVEVVTILLKHKANKNLCDMDGRSPLFEASYKGHVEVVKVLLEHKADKDKCDKDGQSPLFMSSMSGHVEVVEVLLEHKADKDQCDWYGRSPLFIASDHGHVEVVKVLLEHKAKMYQRDKDGLSPLIISSMRGRVKVVEVLLKHKADKDQCDKYDRSPLYMSSMYGHVEVVKVLLEHKADIDQCDWYGQSPLFIASMRGRVEVVKVLLEHKAKIDQCNIYGRSPLFIASYHGHVEVVEVLLEHKAKIYQCDKDSQSPLFISSMRGRVEVVEVLLKHKADKDQCDKYDRSPLYMSSMRGRVEVVKVLLEHKAKIDQCDKDGQSPLHIASDHGHGEVVEVLLEHKAKIDQWDKDGQSPLLISSMRGRVKVVEVLLKHKADKDQCDKYDRSPLYMSSKYGHVEVVKVLLKHKADIDQWDKDGQSPLFIASDYDYVEVVKVLLEYKADKDKCDKHDRSPLFIASDHGHVEVVKVLLEYKADKDQCDKYDRSPLYMSSKYGHVEVVKVLLKHKADIDQYDKYGQSPLFISSMRGRVEVVKALLEHKAELDLCDKKGRSPLHIASSHGHVEVVKVLLEHKAKLDLCDKEGQSPLHIASSYGHVEVVKVLLKHKAVLDLCDKVGQSPLHIASSHGHVEVVKVLLEHKAKLDLCNNEGLLPLHVASSHGHVEVVRVLWEYKSKLDLCDNEGQSPLHVASSHGHVEVVKVLVEHKARLDLCNIEGQSPLHVASSHGHVEVVKVLLENKAKLDLCDKEGQSPLHIASSHGHVKVVKVLVEHKARLDLCNIEGQSPLHVASSHGHVEVVKVLLENKAKLDLCDKEGQSPLHVASSHGHVKVVKVLLKHKAKLYLCDSKGQSPLHLASGHGHVEVIKLPLKHKAEIDICDKEGQSPLNVTSSHGHGVEVLFEHETSFIRRHSIYGSSPLLDSSMRGHAEAVNLLLGYKAKKRQRAKYGKMKIITPVKSNSDHSNLKVLRYRSPIEYLDCEDFNIKRSKEYFQFCKTFCGPQLYTQRELHRRLKQALNILDAKQEEEKDVTLDNTLLSLSKCGKSSYGHLLLAYYLVQLGAHTKTADKYGNSNIHFAVQNRNVFLAILLLQNRDSVVMENTNVDVLKSVIDVHKKKCQHGNIWDKNTKCEHAVIARYISYLIAFQYQRKLSGYYKCLKVWPGYKHQDEISSYQGLHLVVQYDRVREGYSTTVSISLDIPVIWHNVCIVSTEGKYMNFKTQEHEDDEHLIRDFNNFRSIDKQTAKMLFKCHRNLNIISVSMLKSVGYGKNHKIIKKPCVTLYCDVKGIIPVGEEDFNSSLPGHVLDIREGHFSFVAGGRSHEYHDQLKMGCVIGTPKTFPNYGTLGGFVEHKGKTYLLTCAHALFSIQELQRQTSQNMYDRKVVQPQDKNENEIGRVRKFRFPRNTDESETSVDAALVEISSRMPVDGTFPDDDLNNLYKAGYTDLPTFRSGEIKASIERADRRNQVVKFGAKTGLTIGNFNPHKDHVRIRNDDWWITEVQKQRWLTHHIQIFNQYEIAPLVNSTFADEGDSGSFVFMMKNNDENRLQCIGMVIGLTSAGTVLVTPISSILESLFLNADSLKTFDPSAIVERRHANHDPLIPNNVNGALDKGKRGVERRFLLFIVSFGVFILAVLFSAISK